MNAIIKTVVVATAIGLAGCAATTAPQEKETGATMANSTPAPSAPPQVAASTPWICKPRFGRWPKSRGLPAPVPGVGTGCCGQAAAELYRWSKRGRQRPVQHLAWQLPSAGGAAAGHSLGGHHDGVRRCRCDGGRGPRAHGFAAGPIVACAARAHFGNCLCRWPALGAGWSGQARGGVWQARANFWKWHRRNKPVPIP